MKVQVLLAAPFLCFNKAFFVFIGVSRPLGQCKDKGGKIMSKRFKRDLLPKSKIIKKKKKNLEKHQTLGLGPKFIESVSSALRDGDNIHVRKMVEGLSESGLANLIQAFNHS